MTPVLPHASGALQVLQGTDVSVNVDPVGSLVGSAVGTFLTTLVIGAILVAIAPGYTERKMVELVEEPVGALVYGLVSLVFVILVTVVLFITIIGILLAIPFALLASLLWGVGAAIGFLAIADRLVDHREEGWPVPLLLAAAMNGGLTLTGIGGLVAFVVGAAGFGVVLRGWL